MTGTFRVRIGHYVPDAPPVDVLVDGYPVLTDRAFDSINDYTEHEAATYEVSIRAADGDEQLASEPVDFEADTDYTLLLVGTKDDVRLRLLADGHAATAGD